MEEYKVLDTHLSYKYLPEDTVHPPCPGMVGYQDTGGCHSGHSSFIKIMLYVDISMQSRCVCSINNKSYKVQHGPMNLSINQMRCMDIFYKYRNDNDSARGQ